MSDEAQAKSELVREPAPCRGGSTLIVLPVVVLFLFAQRFFIEGITAGGVKV